MTEANPSPDLNLNYADQLPAPELQETQSGTFVIDLHKTTIIDSKREGVEAKFSSFFKRINEDGDLVCDTKKALFGDDEDHKNGEVFDFRYDDDGEIFGAGTAFLKGSE